MQILIVSLINGLSSKSAIPRKKSSYVASQARKLDLQRKGVVPVDGDNFGSISVNWSQDSQVYKITWKSKLTNSVTTLNKLGPDKFLVGRTSPETESVSFMFKDKEPAIKAFFYNTDLFRTMDSAAENARTWCAGHFKRAEGLQSLKFNPKAMLKAQRRFDKIIKVGREREHTAKLLGVDINGEKVRIKLFDSKTNTYGKERTVSSRLAWFE